VGGLAVRKSSLPPGTRGAGLTVTERLVATGRQQTWVDDRLGELQQAALVERAGQGRYRLEATSAPGRFAGGAG
jgi:hypothetical protein